MQVELPADHPLTRRHMLLCPDGTWRSFDSGFDLALAGAFHAAREHAVKNRKSADPGGLYTLYQVTRPSQLFDPCVQFTPESEFSAGYLVQEARMRGEVFVD